MDIFSWIWIDGDIVIGLISRKINLNLYIFKSSIYTIEIDFQYKLKQDSRPLINIIVIIIIVIIHQIKTFILLDQNEFLSFYFRQIENRSNCVIVNY